MNKVFLAIYTHESKQYCDEEFFRNISKISKSVSKIYVVDNSPTRAYIERLQKLCADWGIDASFHYEIVPQGEYRFQRAVLRSVEYLRARFLETDCEYFLIIESDVIPPLHTVKRMTVMMNTSPEYGVIGAVYYSGIHEFDSRGLVEEDCVFSGCSMYRRELLEDVPFTWNEEVSGCFPDSCMKYDAINNGWRVGNIHNLQCEHLK